MHSEYIYLNCVLIRLSMYSEFGQSEREEQYMRN